MEVIRLGEFECPECGYEIDTKYVFLEGSLSHYGDVEKIYETKSHLINRITTLNNQGHFVFEKDTPKKTRKYSFRVKNPNEIFNKDYNQLNYEDKILFTSDGMRFGELDDDPPSNIGYKVVKYNLR